MSNWSYANIFQTIHQPITYNQHIIANIHHLEIITLLSSCLLEYASRVFLSICLSTHPSIHLSIRCQGGLILYLTGAPSLFLDSAPLAPSGNLFCIQSNLFKVHSVLGVVQPHSSPSMFSLAFPCYPPPPQFLPLSLFPIRSFSLLCPLPVPPLPYQPMFSLPFPFPLKPSFSTHPPPAPPPPVRPHPYPSLPIHAFPEPPPLPNLLTCRSPLPVITCYPAVAPRSACHPAPSQAQKHCTVHPHPPGKSQHLSRISVTLLTKHLLILRLSLSIRT